MPDFATARQTMVDTQLRPAGVTDGRLLAAMGEVPRELFLPPAQRHRAYLDAAVRVTANGARELPAPASFARLVQLADIGPRDSVLDIGSGPGYSTIVLARLGAEITGLDWDPGLVSAARTSLLGLGIGNARIVLGALDRPPPGPAYDVIVVEGLLDGVPDLLTGSLAEGGRLAVVLDRAGIGVAHLFVRENGTVTGRPLFDAPMPRLLPERPVAFRF